MKMMIGNEKTSTIELNSTFRLLITWYNHYIEHIPYDYSTNKLPIASVEPRKYIEQYNLSWK